MKMWNVNFIDILKSELHIKLKTGLFKEHSHS